MDRKVPDEEEKKNPTKKKSSSGCHNPRLKKIYNLVFVLQETGLAVSFNSSINPFPLRPLVW